MNNSWLISTNRFICASVPPSGLKIATGKSAAKKLGSICDCCDCEVGCRWSLVAPCLEMAVTNPHVGDGLTSNSQTVTSFVEVAGLPGPAVAMTSTQSPISGESAGPCWYGEIAIVMMPDAYLFARTKWRNCIVSSMVVRINLVIVATLTLVIARKFLAFSCPATASKQ